MERHEQRIERIVREEIEIRPYDPHWPELFRLEKEHLQSCLPADLVRRIEHFGSTAVPDLAAKPIVDILVEVTDLQATRKRIAPLLQSQGYEYFWRPTHSDEAPPFYAWFIKREAHTGIRTHHIHMVEADFAEHWDRLLFRDYLIEKPLVAREYERLKRQLAAASPRDRIAYTQGKTPFVLEVTGLARRYYSRGDRAPNAEEGSTMEKGMESARARDATWPSLPLEAWKDTCATLHLWLQIVGKMRLVQTPWINHSWHVTLYLTSSGLTTSPIPYQARTFELEFDFASHELLLKSSDGGRGRVPLEPQSVATFYRRLVEQLGRIDVRVEIHKKPNEIVDPLPLDEDEVHRAYDRDYAHRFWRLLVQADRVFKVFRARFIGKCSPVHLFWGAPDLAVTRFSGRRAPEHRGGIPNLPDRVAREAYSHEVSSCGFWPGGGPIPYPVFYSYAYPEPAGFSEAKIEPPEAFYSRELGEFVLPYDVVRTANLPDEALLAFLQATYDAAANLGDWDRSALERIAEGEGRLR